MPQRHLNTHDVLSMNHQSGVIERHLHNKLPDFLDIADTFAHTIYEACLEADRDIVTGKAEAITLKVLRADTQHMVDYMADFVHMRGLALMVHNPSAVNVLFGIWRSLLTWNNRMVKLIKLERGTSTGSIAHYRDHFAQVEDWPTRFGFISKAQVVMAEEARLKV